MPSRAREKQLAKLAARRQAEAAARRRRRTLFIALGGGLVIAVVVAVVLGIILGNKPTAAAGSVSPTPSATTATSPCGTPTPPKDSTQTKPTFDKAPPMTIDPSAQYTATFQTSCGTFEAQLLPKTDPQGVNSFVFLANKGFYDGLTFHRIVKGFVIQGGDPKGDGTGGPGYETPVTVTKGSTFDAPGVLAFAHSSTGGNGSQFFVTLAPAPNLNPSASSKYSIFGNVTKGMAIVQKIGSVPTVSGPSCPTGESCSPTEPIFILKVTISEKS
jgi:cyclophilin family peptidyl-prolyl cis-trans isomerase